MEQQGWLDQIYCRIPDELHAHQMAKAREIVALFDEHAPGLPIMATDLDTASVAGLQKAVGLADIWSQSTKNMERPEILQFYHQRLSLGERVWPYIHFHEFIRSDPAACRMFFWSLQKHGFDGATLWGVGPKPVQEYTWFGFIQKQWERPGDGCLYWLPEGHTLGPDVKPPAWRSVRLYKIAKGLEDREYFWLMNDLAAQAQRRGILTENIRQQIADVNQSINEIAVSFLNFSSDMSEVQQIRRNTAALIIALQEKLD